MATKYRNRQHQYHKAILRQTQTKLQYIPVLKSKRKIDFNYKGKLDCN